MNSQLSEQASVPPKVGIYVVDLLRGCCLPLNHCFLKRVRRIPVELVLLKQEIHHMRVPLCYSSRQRSTMVHLDAELSLSIPIMSFNTSRCPFAADSVKTSRTSERFSAVLPAASGSGSVTKRGRKYSTISTGCSKNCPFQSFKRFGRKFPPWS